MRKHLLAFLFIAYFSTNLQAQYQRIAYPDSAITQQETSILIRVTANDSLKNYPDGILCGYSYLYGSLKSEHGGTIYIVSNNYVQYNPPHNFTGKDRFYYAICNWVTGSPHDTALVTVTVYPPNYKPQWHKYAYDDYVTTKKNVPVTFNVLANDHLLANPLDNNYTPNPQVCDFIIPSNDPAWKVKSNGEVTFTPPNNFMGIRSIHYFICGGDSSKKTYDTAEVKVNVIIPNYHKYAYTDTVTTKENTPVDINVFANDSLKAKPSDINYVAHPVICNMLSQTIPIGGETINVAYGIIEYKPPINFTGKDLFYYAICDTATNKDVDTARVIIKVVPSNVHPHIHKYAYPDIATTIKNQSVSINVLANDSLNARTSDYNYIPNPVTNNYYTNSINGGKAWPQNGGIIVYVPPSYFVGTDQFKYFIYQSGTAKVVDTATVTVKVLAQNPPPHWHKYAHTDNYTVQENTPVIINVLANDSLQADPTDENYVPNPALCWINNTTIRGGKIKSLTYPLLEYTPPLNFTGQDNFDYLICNNGSTDQVDSTMVYFNVGTTNVHTHKYAYTDKVSTNENTSITIDVLANDSLEAKPTDINYISNPVLCENAYNSWNGGSVNIVNNEIIYNPPPYFTGTDHFVYGICNSGSSNYIDTTSVTVQVLMTINHIYAHDDNATTDVNTGVIINVFANDSLKNIYQPSACDFPYTYGSLKSKQGGTLSYFNNDKVEYIPPANFTGTDEFYYAICNALGATHLDTARVTVFVKNSSIRSGLRFDGINDYATVPHNAAYDIGYGDFTIEAWINADSIQTTNHYPVIISNREISNSYTGFMFFLGVGYTIELQTKGVNHGPTGIDLRDGKCHHVAVVRSSDPVYTSRLTWYVDGVFQITITDANYDLSSTASIVFGEDLNDMNKNHNDAFKGSIKEVRFWNIARSQAELQFTMSSRISGKETGLIGYWRLNESTGQTIVDYSPVNNPGFPGSTSSEDVNDPSFSTVSCSLDNTNSQIISGFVNYDNKSLTPLNNCKVILYKTDGNKIDSANTDQNGAYQISNVADGNYILKCSTTNSWAGANPLDALMTNRCYIGIYSFIDPLYKLAADVNRDNKINPSDALLINRRYIGALKKFSAPDWIFDNPAVTVSGQNVSQNIKAICAGDVNGSY